MSLVYPLSSYLSCLFPPSVLLLRDFNLPLSTEPVPIFPLSNCPLFSFLSLSSSYMCVPSLSSLYLSILSQHIRYLPVSFLSLSMSILFYLLVQTFFVSTIALHIYLYCLSYSRSVCSVCILYLPLIPLYFCPVSILFFICLSCLCLSFIRKGPYLSPLPLSSHGAWVLLYLPPNSSVLLFYISMLPLSVRPFSILPFHS